ncbi:MAG: ComEC/Rec2 family competence protein [Verrucomicrobiota bacterium]
MTIGLVSVPAVVLTDRWAYVPGIVGYAMLIAAFLLALRLRHWWRWLPFCAALFVCIHGWRLADTFEHPLRQHLLTLPDRPQFVKVTGRLYPWTEGAELDDANAIGDLIEVKMGDEKHFTKARVKVSLPEGFRLEKPGVYEITGQVSLPRPPMNPGQYDPVKFSLLSGWVAWVKAEQVTLKQEEKWSPAFHLLHGAEHCRQWIMRALSLGIEDRPQDTAVLLAMALGASDAAGDDIEDAFRDSGTLHIFAVSGLHVVMLALVLGLALRWIGVGQSRMTVVIILVVFAYAYITGWRPSAARAAFMIAIVLGAVRWNQRADVHNSLGLALLMLLLWDSNQLFMPGFQLSFLVLWAIAGMATPLIDRLRPWTELDPFYPPSLASWHHWGGRWIRQQSASLACTSLAAWIGSLPLTLGHFSTMTPVGLVANLLLVPVSGISIGLSCASLLFARVGLSTLQIFVNHVNAWLASFMVLSAGWFAALPGANVVLDMRFEKTPPPMELHVFHMQGGGSSGYLRAHDKRWLIDTGNVRPWRRVVRPFMRHQGINGLDGILLTHRDIAHVGAASLALDTGVPRLVTSIHEPWTLDPGVTLFDQLGQRTKIDGPVWHRHKMSDVISIDQGASIQVLYPGTADLHDTADNRCLVLMIYMGPTRVLWLGDAGFITEKRLLERHDDLRCDILVHGCHSTDPGGLTELLLAAQPRVIISESDSRFAEAKTPHRFHDYCQKHEVPHLQLEITGGVQISISPDGAALTAHRSGTTYFLAPETR